MFEIFMTMFNLKKGFTIRIDGSASREITGLTQPDYAALKPGDFPGITPSLLVREGDRVKPGTPLFTDKAGRGILFVSPISGSIRGIIRGERRAIREIVITRDGKSSPSKIPGSLRPDAGAPRDDMIKALLTSGLFPSFRQRPYAVVADPSTAPRDIFISAFDTSPLAPSTAAILEGNGEYLSTGLKVLSRLTSGKVHVSIEKSDTVLEKLFTSVPEIILHHFSGPHPAGCVGVQIHHIAPVRNARDIVWYCSLESAVRIGRLFNTGIPSYETTVAIAGPAAPVRGHFRTLMGARISSLLKGYDEDPKARYISGNVLTGKASGYGGFLGYYDNLVSIISETAGEEFLGWLKPGFRKESASRTFLSRFLPLLPLIIDTNRNGSVRPFVATGIYEKVLPMNIHPVHLIKSILAADIEEMEGLGIYEVAEEELALCEYICPSKTNMQAILRQGIDLMMREG